MASSWIPAKSELCLMNLDYLCGFAKVWERLIRDQLLESGSFTMGAGAYPSKDGSYLVRCSEEDCGRAEGAMGSVEGEAAKAA